MNAVVVGDSVMVVNVYVGNLDILTVGEYHSPAGRVEYLDACDLDILTVVEENGHSVCE